LTHITIITAAGAVTSRGADFLVTGAADPRITSWGGRRSWADSDQPV